MESTNYEFGAVPGDLLQYVKDKRKSSKYWFQYLLVRTKMMFQYKGLPDTIDATMLERYLQVNGIACVTEVDGKLYAFNGSMGGKQDVYYKPTLFVVANPHFKQTFSKNIIIGEEGTNFNDSPLDSQPGVLMRNDSEWIGLSPLIAKYAVMLAENLLTIRSADVMLRIIALITASSDKSYKSAMAYLNKLEKGEFGAISDDSFSENQINMQSPPSNNGSYLTQFIELHQYLIGSFYNELGLRANYNMKREAIGQGESSMDEDAIMPLCDDMLLRRKEDVAKINDMYGTNISVDYSSAWLSNKIERTLLLLSQLSESGAGQVGDSGADMGQNGSTEVNSETKGESDNENKDGTGNVSDNNRTERSREDELSGKTGGKSEGADSYSGAGKSEASGGGGASEEERTDAGERDRNSGEKSGNYGKDLEESGGDNSDAEKSVSSKINDIVLDDIPEKIDEYLDDVKITEKQEPDFSQLKGGDENGFLGEIKGSGDEDDTSNN